MNPKLCLLALTSEDAEVKDVQAKFNETDDVILGKLHKAGLTAKDESGGSTYSALILTSTKIHAISLGDNRLYLVHHDKEKDVIMERHDIYAPGEQTRVEGKGGLISEGKVKGAGVPGVFACTRSVGHFSAKQGEAAKFMSTKPACQSILRNQGFIAGCICHGFNSSDQDVMDLIRRNTDSSTAAKSILEHEKNKVGMGVAENRILSVAYFKTE